MSIWLPFFKKRKTKKADIQLKEVPDHVAIIMDGNGRWAQKRGLPRIAGHKEGMDVVRRIAKCAVKHNIKTLTLYAFSTENWKRPKSEVDYLMKLPKQFLHIYLPEMNENNVRIETIGEFDSLPDHTKEAINYAKEKTKENDGLVLNLAINYGSRAEIMCAIKRMFGDLSENNLSPDDISEEVFSNYLFTKEVGDPDLLIRTSGEQRLSNFLLWQVAYSEFWFTDVLWPDFNEEIFERALLDYEKRIRRYGGI